MEFHYNYQTSDDADDLAMIYLARLNLDTSQKLRGNSSYQTAWAVMFDRLLRSYPCSHIKAVLDYYFKTVREKDAFVHLEPDSFHLVFPVLMKQCRRRINPIPESEFSTLIQEFRKCRFDADRELLVATLGQSLWALRRFKDVLDHSDLSQAKKDFLRTRMGSPYSYIREKLLPPKPWGWDRTYRLPKPVTYKALCEDAVALLRAYGMSSKTVRDVFCNAVCGNRPR